MNRYRSRPRSLCGSMRSVYHRVGAGKHRRHVRARRWERAKVCVTGRSRQRPSCCCRRIVQGTFTCSVHHAQGPQVCSAAPSTRPPAARGSPTRSCREELPNLCVGRSGGCSVRPGAPWGGGWQSDALSVSATHFGPFSPRTESAWCRNSASLGKRVSRQSVGCGPVGFLAPAQIAPIGGRLATARAAKVEGGSFVIR
jgi:hypothetical protein